MGDFRRFWREMLKIFPTILGVLTGVGIVNFRYLYNKFWFCQGLNRGRYYNIFYQMSNLGHFYGIIVDFKNFMCCNMKITGVVYAFRTLVVF